MSGIHQMLMSYPKKGYTPTANTVARYKLDGNLNDSSGLGNNLTTSSGITYATGQLGQCANFGTADTGYAYTGSRDTDFEQSEITIMAWVNNSSSTSNDHTIFMYNVDNTKRAYEFIIQSVSGGATEQIALRQSSATLLEAALFVNTTYTFPSGSWHCVGVSRKPSTGETIFMVDGNTVTMTGNNTPIYTTTTSAGYALGGTLFNVGAISNNYRGYMDEVVVEKVARTSSQLLDFYNLTK